MDEGEASERANGQASGPVLYASISYHLKPLCSAPNRNVSHTHPWHPPSRCPLASSSPLISTLHYSLHSRDSPLLPFSSFLSNRSFYSYFYYSPFFPIVSPSRHLLCSFSFTLFFSAVLLTVRLFNDTGRKFGRR